MEDAKALVDPSAESAQRLVDRLVDRAQSGEAADALGDHGAGVDYATAGVNVAGTGSRDGWLAVCLSMRALQLMSNGQSSSDSYDETRVMRDLAQAQLTLLAGVESIAERVAAYCNLAVAYTRLRLYELAVPMHLETAMPVGGQEPSPEAALVQQLNLATLHLTWTLELLHAVTGPHAETWAERARLFAGCALAHGPDPLAGVRQMRRSLAPTSAGARAGLELSRTLSEMMWRQRARRLGTAEALLRFERLQAEHEVVTGEADLDPLTGTATRRALDRRMALLAGRDLAEEPPVCVVVIDLDRLKRINDELGHPAGDLALRHVGAALLCTVRGDDLVGRFGGDEFVALLKTELDGGLARRAHGVPVDQRRCGGDRVAVWRDETAPAVVA